MIKHMGNEHKALISICLKNYSTHMETVVLIEKEANKINGSRGPSS